MDRLVGWVNSRSLLKLAFVIFAGGGILVCLSFVLGIDAVVDPETGRDVGYAQATNWIGTFMVLLPLATIGLAWLVAVLARLVPELQEKMLAPHAADADWRGHLRKGVPWLVVFALMAVTMSVYQCWIDSYRPLFEVGSADRVSWATAALVEGETVSPGLNFAFAAVAWAMQAVAVLVFSVLLWQVLTFAVWLAKYGLGLGNTRLVPDLKDPDPRCGFQRFELPGALLFGIVTLFLMLVWLVIAYNVSRSAQAPGTWAHAFDYGANPLAGLFATGATEYDVFWARATGLAAVMLGLVLVVGVMVPVAIQIARTRQLAQLGEDGEGRDRLLAMPAWPYRFVSGAGFGLLVALGVAGMWFFRLAPWALLTTIAVIALRARGQLMRGGHVRIAYAGLIAVALLGAVMVGKALHTNTGERGIVPAGGVVATGGFLPEYTNSHALLIGIGYDGVEFSKLANAERDAAKLKEVLEGMAGNWRIRTLLGDEATFDGILQGLADLSRDAKRDDRVFVFYAGHGTPTGERTGWLVPADAKSLRTDPAKTKWISFGRITDTFLDEIRAKHVLLALDCCYSGRVTRSGGSQPDSGSETLARLKAKHLMGKAHVVIAAGKKNEVVADGPPGGHSPFATALFAALKSDRKVITAPVLCGRIAESFLDNDANQTPVIDYLTQGGEFCFFPVPG